jgi:hypothetical protein
MFRYEPGTRPKKDFTSSLTKAPKKEMKKNTLGRSTKLDSTISMKPIRKLNLATRMRKEKGGEYQYTKRYTNKLNEYMADTYPSYYRKNSVKDTWIIRGSNPIYSGVFDGKEMEMAIWLGKRKPKKHIGDFAHELYHSSDFRKEAAKTTSTKLEHLSRDDRGKIQDLINVRDYKPFVKTLTGDQILKGLGTFQMLFYHRTKAEIAANRIGNRAAKTFTNTMNQYKKLSPRQRALR